MTPKEKAEELCNKMYEVGWANHSQTKKYALIAVDEIINAFKNKGNKETIEYWQQVKKKIKKL